MIKIRKRWFVALLALIAIIIVIKYFGIWDKLSFARLKENREALRFYVQTHYTVAALFFIGLYIFVTALLLPFAAGLTLVGGYIFGVLPTVLFANIGATIGSCLSFLIVRYLFTGTFGKKYQKRKELFDRLLAEHKYSFLLSIHFISVIPLGVINIVTALTNVDFLTFLWTKSLGIIPGSFVFSFAGQELGSIDSVKDVFSPKVLLAFALLGLLGLVPVILKKIKKTNFLDHLSS